MSGQPSQSGKKPIFDRISIFEQKQAVTSSSDRNSNSAPRRKVTTVSTNFSAIKSQFDAGTVRKGSPPQSPKNSVSSVTGSKSQAPSRVVKGSTTSERKSSSDASSGTSSRRSSQAKSPRSSVASIEAAKALSESKDKASPERKESLASSDSPASVPSSAKTSVASVTSSNPPAPARTTKSVTPASKTPIKARSKTDSVVKVAEPKTQSAKSSAASFSENNAKNSPRVTKPVSPPTKTTTAAKPKVETADKAGKTVTTRSSTTPVTRSNSRPLPQSSKQQATTAKPSPASSAPKVESVKANKPSATPTGQTSPKNSVASVGDGNLRPAIRVVKTPLSANKSQPIAQKATSVSVENTEISPPATPISSPKSSVGSIEDTNTKPTPRVAKTEAVELKSALKNSANKPQRLLPTVPPKPLKSTPTLASVAQPPRKVPATPSGPPQSILKNKSSYDAPIPKPEPSVKPEAIDDVTNSGESERVLQNLPKAARPQFPDVSSKLNSLDAHENSLIKPAIKKQVPEPLVKKVQPVKQPVVRKPSNTSAEKNKKVSLTNQSKKSITEQLKPDIVEKNVHYHIDLVKTEIEPINGLTEAYDNKKKDSISSQPEELTLEEETKSSEDFEATPIENETVISIAERVPTTESVALHINLTKKNTVTHFDLDQAPLQRSFSGLSFVAETSLEVSPVQNKGKPDFQGYSNIQSDFEEIVSDQRSQKLSESDSESFASEDFEFERSSKKSVSQEDLISIPVPSKQDILNYSVEDLDNQRDTKLSESESNSSSLEDLQSEILKGDISLEKSSSVIITELPDQDFSVSREEETHCIQQASSHSSIEDLSYVKEQAAPLAEVISLHEVVEPEKEEEDIQSLNGSQATKKLSVSSTGSSLSDNISSERSRENSVSSDGSSARSSLSDLPGSVLNSLSDQNDFPVIPSVTITVDPVSAPPSPLIIGDTKPDFGISKSRNMTDDLNLKNLEPSAGLERRAYWSSQALQNENSQKLNEALKLDLSLNEDEEDKKKVLHHKDVDLRSDGEELSQLKKQKHDLELKLRDEEDEIDDLVGQVQMLEQTKLKLEASISAIKKEHRNELAQKDEELEEIRTNSLKKLKVLEQQLESDHEERIHFVREKHELETRIMNLQQMASASTNDDELIIKMRKDLKRTKALLRDAQSAMEKTKNESTSKVVLRQLKNQLEDAEFAKTAALKFRQNLELELSDVQQQLDDVLRGKADLEDRLMRLNREKADLSSHLAESEEELQEVMKKFKASVAQLSVDQLTIQEQANRISEAEEEKMKLKEQISELNQKIEALEGESVTDAYQNRLNMKIKELESKLELEQTTRGRMETQINRLKEGIEKVNSECDQLRMKEQVGQEQCRKLQRQLREIRQELVDAQQKDTEYQAKKSELEKQLELSEAEAILSKNDLKLALKRIEDLQTALNGEIDSESDSQNSDYDSDSSEDSFLGSNRRPMVPKIKTTFVRDTFRSRHLETMSEEPEYHL